MCLVIRARHSSRQKLRGLRVWNMFSVALRRVVQRPTFAQRLRCLASQVPPSKIDSQQSPPPPLPSASHVPSLDFQPTEQGPERTQRTGAKSSKDSLSSIERKRRLLARFSLAILAVGIGVQLVYLGREWDPEEFKGKKLVWLFDICFMHFVYYYPL